MKTCISVLAILMATHVHSAVLTDVSVTGDSVFSFANLATDPAIISITTSGLGASVVEFTHNDSAPGVNTSLVLSNQTSTDWLGLSFVLTGGGFTSNPVPTFGGDEGVVSGPNSEFSSLTVDFLAGGTLFLDLSFTLDANPTTLTFTPVIPEPTLAAVILLIPLAAVRSHRFRKK